MREYCTRICRLEAGADESTSDSHSVMKIVVGAGFIVLAMILVPVLGVAVLMGGASNVASLPVVSKSVQISGQAPPASIVAIDTEVAEKGVDHGTCHIPLRVLLAQQYMESGWNPGASSGIAFGLAQFELPTWREYAMNLPAPGGIFNPLDSATVEARYLCSLGFTQNPFAALVAYRCGALSWCVGNGSTCNSNGQYPGPCYARHILTWAEDSKQ